jgi:hypothetical protein
MTQAERESDQFRRSIVGNVIAEGVTGKMQAAMQATTLLGRTLRGGAAFALNEALSTAFDDSTAGNPVDALNMIPGVELPGAVNVGQDDMLDAYLKSIVPNAGTGLAVGAGAGLAALGSATSAATSALSGLCNGKHKNGPGRRPWAFCRRMRPAAMASPPSAATAGASGTDHAATHGGRGDAERC